MQYYYDDSNKGSFFHSFGSQFHVKLGNVYVDLVGNVQKRFDTSNYEIKRPLPIDKNKRKIGLMKDELDGR